MAVLSLLATIMLAARAWGSHAIDQGPVSVVIYLVHEVAAALWLGSLAGLAFVSGPPSEWPQNAAQQTSSLAGWCVAVLVVTGLYAAYRQLGINVALLEYSAYGRVLVYKLATAATVVVIGAYNRFRLVPMQSSGKTRALLKRNVQAEALILTGVLYWSALLANTAPPH